jgi:hypothetical protein
VWEVEVLKCDHCGGRMRILGMPARRKIHIKTCDIVYPLRPETVGQNCRFPLAVAHGNADQAGVCRPDIVSSQRSKRPVWTNFTVTQKVRGTIFKPDGAVSDCSGGELNAVLPPVVPMNLRSKRMRGRRCSAQHDEGLNKRYTYENTTRNIVDGTQAFLFK